MSLRCRDSMRPRPRGCLARVLWIPKDERCRQDATVLGTWGEIAPGMHKMDIRGRSTLGEVAKLPLDPE